MNSTLLDKLKTLKEEEKEILKGNNVINLNLYMSPSSNIVDSNKILGKNKLIYVQAHTRFIHFSKHGHNYVEFVYMCQGHTFHIVDDEVIELKAGELLFLSQSVMHEVFPADFEDIAVNFIILPEFFDYTLKMIGSEKSLLRNFIVGCHKKNNNHVSYLHYKVSDVLPIQNLVENLIWNILIEKQSKRSINQITMGLLFLQLMNFTDKLYVGKTNFEEELMIKLLSFIEENYKEGSLTDFANILHCDLHWLSRMIKKITGKTFTQLKQIKRLDQAAYLLTTTNLTVSDISYAVGYSNVGYFHRIFQKRFSTSPNNYRKCK
jgi:AraC-like DNA-binding protein/mannose-6-phosphate isomerase-like protein (cupin superfamily)